VVEIAFGPLLNNYLILKFWNFDKQNIPRDASFCFTKKSSARISFGVQISICLKT
jgi:hypothetical protein